MLSSQQDFQRDMFVLEEDIRLCRDELKTKEMYAFDLLVPQCVPCKLIQTTPFNLASTEILLSV